MIWQGIKAYFLNPVRSQYADFNGRTDRKHFWFFQVFYGAATVMVFLAVSLYGAFSNALTGPLPLLASALIIGYFILSLGLITPTLAIGCRRLHDCNFSGWWLLLVLVPYGLLLLFVFFCLPGKPETNRFGPAPAHNMHRPTTSISK